MVQRTEEKKKADARELREGLIASYSRLIAGIENRLRRDAEIPALIAHAFVCVDSLGTLAIGETEWRKRKDTLGFVLITGDMIGIVKHTKENAEKLAAHWNAHPATQAPGGGTQPGLRVEVKHYTEALRTRLADAREQLAMLMAPEVANG